MSERCERCRWWTRIVADPKTFPEGLPEGAHMPGHCNRFPQIVTTPPSYVCGEFDGTGVISSHP